jgi:hypothetical protein
MSKTTPPGSPPVNPSNANLDSKTTRNLFEYVKSKFSNKITALSLYMRDFKYQSKFNPEKQVWEHSIDGEEGDAGVYCKFDDNTCLLMEVLNDSGSIYWETATSYRFNVKPFSLAMVVKGPIETSLLFDYLEKQKYRVYSKETAVLPRDFAIDLVESLKENREVKDMRSEMVAALSNKQGNTSAPGSKQSSPKLKSAPS